MKNDIIENFTRINPDCNEHVRYIVREELFYLINRMHTSPEEFFHEELLYNCETEEESQAITLYLREKINETILEILQEVSL